jgi:hypothetical protein
LTAHARAQRFRAWFRERVREVFLIAAPWNERAALRVAAALETAGVVRSAFTPSRRT